MDAVLRGGELDGTRVLKAETVTEMGRNQIGELRAGCLDVVGMHELEDELRVPVEVVAGVGALHGDDGVEPADDLLRFGGFAPLDQRRRDMLDCSCHDHCVERTAFRPTVVSVADLDAHIVVAKVSQQFRSGFGK